VVLAVMLSAGCKRQSSVDRSDGKIPLLEAPRLQAGAVTIDGKLDDPAWRRAPSTGHFVHPGTGKAVPGSPVNAEARVAWDPGHLLLCFTVKDSAPTSPFSPKDEDPHVWERSSAVEVMLQPGDPKDNRAYFEIQVDVAGAVWDTRFDDYNRPITMVDGNRRFGHQSWKSGLEQAVVVDKRRGRYTMEIAVPWSALKNPRAKTPPASGDVWRFNLYSFRDGQRHALAWSPILGQGNFHRTSRFGRVRFK
jgi:hypothetical protein